MSIAIVQRFYTWLDENTGLIHLTFSFWWPASEIDAKRAVCLLLCRLWQPEMTKAGEKNKYPTHLVWLSVPWRKMFEKMHGKKMWHVKCPMNWQEYVFVREQDGVCASWPVASLHLSLISLLPCVSVGMQRVSSLRTQRVAGSSSECKAHKKEHDWQFKDSPFLPITGPKEGGGMYDCTDVPFGEAGQGASAANRRRAMGGQSARRSTAR